MSKTRTHTHVARATHTRRQIDSELLHKFDSIAIFISHQTESRENVLNNITPNITSGFNSAVSTFVKIKTRVRVKLGPKK